MIRSIVVHDIPRDSIAAMERCTFRVRAPEIVPGTGRGRRGTRVTFRCS
jgi:hypothetical protein